MNHTEFREFLKLMSNQAAAPAKVGFLTEHHQSTPAHPQNQGEPGDPHVRSNKLNKQSASKEYAQGQTMFAQGRA